MSEDDKAYDELTALHELASRIDAAIAACDAVIQGTPSWSSPGNAIEGDLESAAARVNDEIRRREEARS